MLATLVLGPKMIQASRKGIGARDFSLFLWLLYGMCGTSVASYVAMVALVGGC